MTAKSTATILLIEDDVNALKLLSTYLSNHNFTILVAKSSEVGIERATYAQPDIILLDVMLPDENGFETCRKLKADPVTANIPVIFLTSLNSPEDEIKGYQLGAVDFISKPLHEESILVRVNTQLRLRDLTERLEQKVEERTFELRQANQKLAQEIKERIVVETALRESERRLRDAQRIGNFGFLDWDIVNDEIEWSTQTYHIYGFAPESTNPSVEVTENLIHPDDQKFVQQQLRSALAGESEIDLEHKLLRPDGQVIYVHVIADITRNEDGKPVRMLGTVTDITARKRAEEALAQTANLLSNVVNTSRDWIFVKDTELRTVFCNEAFANALGKTPEQLVGKTDIENGWDPDMVKGNPDKGFHGYEAHDLKVLSGETLFVASDPALANGELHSFDTIKMPLRDEMGEIIGVLGVARDVTKRKHAEEALAESEQKYRSLIETMGEGFGMLDKEGFITYVNDSFCRMMGYKREELVGQLVLNLVDETNKQILLEQIERTAAEGGSPYELAWQAKSGENIATITAPRVLKDSEGNFMGSFAVMTDIRKLKEAEQEQHLSDELLKQMPDGIIVADLEGTIRRWLGGAETIFGYRAEEVIGKSVSFLHHPDIRDSMRPKILKELQATDRFFGEILCVHKNGHVVPIEISIKTVFDPDGNPIALVSDSKDITRRKEIEAQVQRSERMAAIGQLSTGIAHDFNNILAAITLYTELLLRNSENTAVTADRLQTILQQSKRASTLINQLLDFSRRSALEKAPVNLLDPLQELITLLKRMLSENIIIKLEYESSEYMVYADTTRLQQIFMNLAVNARDAMPQGGQLTFTLNHLTLGEYDHSPFPGLTLGDWVQVDIADSGEGMPKEVVQRVFEPFFTTKAPGKGTGLGLAQVYGIVKQHEGFIFIRSEEGKGSTFSLFLPALPMQNSKQPHTLHQSKLLSGHGETVLVVEDNPDTRDAVVTSLEVLNYTVIIADDGVEALQILTQDTQRIDLLLSDMIMPNMGGTELLQMLQKENVHVPIVMLSGYFLEDELDNLRELGMLAWLPKPPELAQLAQTIYSALHTKDEKVRTKS